MSLTTRSTCRGCGGELASFLALGDQPLANHLPRLDDLSPVARFPLTLSRCLRCDLVQLREVVDPALLFDDYAYVPSTSTTMRAHFDALAAEATERLGLTDAHLVVDVGSNDGLLLSCFQRRGIRVQGIEPAAHLAARASARGLPTVPAFFSVDVARDLAGTRRAALVTATNVFAHVDDLHGFLEAAFTLLAPDGILLVEVQSFSDTVAHLAFDMTYHEHLTYYATAPLARLCATQGLELLDVERVATHGGSLRAMIGRSGHPLARPARRAARIAEEAQWIGAAGCEALARGAEAVRHDLPNLLRTVVGEGGSVAGYGAPAKATVLLNYCGLGTRDLKYVVDRNEAKQDRRIPGVDVPVVAPERLTQDPPSHLLLLAWNLAAEIRAEQADFAAAGGRFVLPVPSPAIVP